MELFAKISSLVSAFLSFASIVLGFVMLYQGFSLDRTNTMLLLALLFQNSSIAFEKAARK